jgi:hypothetical protein
MIERPELRFSDELEELLAPYSRAVRAALLDWFSARLEPGTLIESERVSERPLAPGPLGRAVDAPADQPRLERTASKFGGLPYLLDAAEWPTAGGARLPFLGQIRFDELDGSIPGVPAHGLLALYRNESLQGEPLAFRWYPAPAARPPADPGTDTPCAPRYEARIRASRVWAPPEEDSWEAILGRRDDAIWDAVLEWTSAFKARQGIVDGCHQLMPPAPAALTRALGGHGLGDRRVLLRLDSDPIAGFEWGSKVIYVLARRDDLAGDRLDRLEAVACDV